MEITDRMGGFVAVRIIASNDIKLFQKKGSSAKIELHPGKQFTEISVKKEGILPSISVSEEKAGQIFTINVEIFAKNQTDFKLLPFRKYVLIVKNPLGVEYILGAPPYSLIGYKYPTFSKTAAGTMGETLIFKGKQPDYPYRLEQ